MFAARNIRDNEWRLSRKFLDETQIKNLVRYIYLVMFFFIPSWNMSICKIMPMCIKYDRRFQKKQAVSSSKQENWIINRSILFYFSIKLFMYINWQWKTSTWQNNNNSQIFSQIFRQTKMKNKSTEKLSVNQE